MRLTRRAIFRVTLGALVALPIGLPSASVLAQSAPTGSSAPPVLSEPADFELEETSGAMRTLHDVRGRLVIVFYEDREHTPDNQELKLLLHRFVEDNHLRDRITTYGVADVFGIDGVVRDMARTAIRAIAAQYGIQILLDWTGVLRGAPFGFPAAASTIGVFDRAGRLRYRVSGAHSAAQRSDLFRTLRQLLRETE